jgi:hypothetical protein
MLLRCTRVSKTLLRCTDAFEVQDAFEVYWTLLSICRTLLRCTRVLGTLLRCTVLDDVFEV